MTARSTEATIYANQPHELRTDRLLLRRWRPADREPFAAINADPRVMEQLPGPLSRSESDAMAARIETHFEQNGFGLWAVEIAHELSANGADRSSAMIRRSRRYSHRAGQVRQPLNSTTPAMTVISVPTNSRLREFEDMANQG